MLWHLRKTPCVSARWEPPYTSGRPLAPIVPAMGTATVFAPRPWRACFRYVPKIRDMHLNPNGLLDPCLKVIALPASSIPETIGFQHSQDGLLNRRMKAQDSPHPCDRHGCQSIMSVIPRSHCQSETRNNLVPAYYPLAVGLWGHGKSASGSSTRDPSKATSSLFFLKRHPSPHPKL